MLLVDSSAWIEYLRRTQSPAHLAVVCAVEAGTAATTDAILLEVLAGTASVDVDRVMRLLGNQHFVGQEPILDVRAAADVYHACRRQGSTPRSIVDCLIAAVAMRAGLWVLHSDRDFDVIARHVPLQVASG
jgi:predicted nucleic acid-binding protein